MAPQRVTVVKASERKAAQQTSGMTREEAYSGDGVWAGYVRSQPRTPSGWHHHGENDSYIFILQGRLQFDFGAGGKETVQAGPGDFVRVPPGVIHRENNPTGEEGRFVVLRFGKGAPNVNCDGPAKA